MNIFRFLEWKMYQDAKRLNQKVTLISQSLPFEIRKKYANQWNRASLSVCLNIAEAAGRYSDMEMCRHFDIALGSLAEVVSCADNLKDEKGILSGQFQEIYQDALNIAKQIQGMKNNVYKNPRIFKKDFEYIA